eukprot:scaffold189412_cov27-Tisochrysis_lutea.AAC.1
MVEGVGRWKGRGRGKDQPRRFIAERRRERTPPARQALHPRQPSPAPRSAAVHTGEASNGATHTPAATDRAPVRQMPLAR